MAIADTAKGDLFSLAFQADSRIWVAEDKAELIRAAGC